MLGSRWVGSTPRRPPLARRCQGCRADGDAGLGLDAEAQGTPPPALRAAEPGHLVGEYVCDQRTSYRGCQPAGCGPPRQRTGRSPANRIRYWNGSVAWAYRGRRRQQALGKALTPAEQLGFADAAVFSLQWNNNTDFAARGAAIASTKSEVGAARAKARGTPPDGLRAALYWLGFDIATGIFGNPALGAQGNTLIGPGSEKIRATVGPDGQQGFNDSLAFNVRRR